MTNRFASDLLSIQAVFLRPDEPFTWASGIKSPIYTDNRLILSAPDVRNRVEQGLADLVQTAFPDVEMLMGTATAGIAHAALVAERLALPMGYVRGSSKDHGRQNRIEGKMAPGTKVVVIEDLVSTGKSVLGTVDALREAGGTVLGVVSIFTYGMQKSKAAFGAAGVPLKSLVSFDEVLEAAAADGAIQPEDIDRLLRFRDDPSDESWIQKGE